MRPDQRVDQFMRLREVIEERASRKFFEEQAADRPTNGVAVQRFLVDSRYFPSSTIIEGTARRRRSSPMSALAQKRALLVAVACPLCASRDISQVSLLDL